MGGLVASGSSGIGVATPPTASPAAVSNLTIGDTFKKVSSRSDIRDRASSPRERPVLSTPLQKKSSGSKKTVLGT